MEKPFDIVLLEQEIGGIELFVSSDEKIESSFKLNKTVIIDKNNNVIGFNLSHCRIQDIKPLQKFKDLEYLYLSNNMIIDVTIIKTFKKLKYLDLSSNKIEDISPINGLTEIEDLNLDNNKIKEIPQLNLPKLLSLDINSNEIDDISGLQNLNSLISLNISYNKFKNIDSLKSLNKLESINLRKNEISDISPISNFKNLYSLVLSDNKINDLTPLSNFIHFDALNLENNQIEDVTPLSSIDINELFIGENYIVDLGPLYKSFKTKKIRFINVNNSPNLLYPTEEIAKKGEDRIVDWFEQWFELTSKNIERCNQKINEIRNDNSIKSLDLGMMGLTDLSVLPNLFELENLEELILSNVWAEFNTEKNEWEPKFSENKLYKNNIISIPNDIIKLKKIKKLIIGGDWKDGEKWNRWRIKDISFINKLDSIEFINLSNNSIDTFKITRNLNLLETIHINNNYIKNISISKAINLKYLFVSNNQIENLNFLKKSLILNAIDLHSNKVKDLYPIRELISRLGIINDQWKYDTISIAKNNLENPGMEVVDRGKEAVLRIIKSNFGNKNTFKNDELKLILVGNSETGKTTLAKYLVRDTNFKARHPFTLWMDIIKINHGNIKINVFDFGGHEYFHDTHHIFFTKNCIYVLIWDKSTDDYKVRDLDQMDVNGNPIKLKTIDYPLFYWLDSIKHFIKDKTPDNFSDEMKNVLKENNSETYNASSLIIQNKVKSRNNLKLLNHLDISNKYPFIYDFINIDLHDEKNLNLLEDRLDEMIEELGILSGGKYPMYYQKIKENIYNFKSYLGKKIINFSEFKRLCKGFIRNLTTDEEFLDIAYFLKDIGLILISNDKKTYYLDLNFISHQIIKIYDGLEKENGVLKEKNIREKNIDEYENILKLIIDFNMAFELNINKTKNYVFPLFLPQNPSKIVDLLIKKNIKPYKRIQYKGFMHKGIILHVFSEYSNKIINEDVDKNTYYWKNGLIVKENNSLVLIKFFEGDKSNDAYIDLFNLDSDLLFVENIKNKIIEINKENQYEVEEYVSVDGVNFISLNLIHENEDHKNEVFLNEKDSKYYKLYDFKKYLKNKNNSMKKVFISYSRQNLQFKDNLKTHLSILERYGLLKAWSCEEIVAGKWNQQIQKELEESDIIIYMVSADFMSSDYIMNDEVKKGIELVRKNPEKKIICVLVGVCQWNKWSVFEEIHIESKGLDDKYSTMDLSQFQFLPYHQYKNDQGVSIREEIVALEKWGRYPYDVINEAYNQIVSKVFYESK